MVWCPEIHLDGGQNLRIFHSYSVSVCQDCFGPAGLTRKSVHKCYRLPATKRRVNKCDWLSAREIYIRTQEALDDGDTMRLTDKYWCQFFLL